MSSKRKNNSRRKVGTGAEQHLASRIAALQTQVSGKVIRCNPDPPKFVSVPWNNLTVGLTFTSDDNPTRGLITVEDLAADVLAQIGGPDGVPIDFRLRMLRSWGKSDSSEDVGFNFYNIDIFDLTNLPATDNSTDHVFTSINDTEAKNRYASFGFMYPKNMFNRVLNGDGSSSGLEIILGIDFKANSTVLLYFDLLWRFTPPQNAIVRSKVHGSLLAKELQTER
jgi:hypothetical protein